ncbi:MAG: FtsX-like permease family protein [Hyphomicrobium sp.]|nr:FtsX-like permease family protein [Hyphomicrobium sp.]
MTVTGKSPAGAPLSARDARRVRWPLVAALALRELRAGLRGFYVFIACVALGVAIIAAVGTLSDALRAGFAEQGRLILGGDVSLSRMHARATDTERAWMAARGAVSETATLRTMARRPDGSEESLAELKSVDSTYPLVGHVTVKERPFADAIRDGAVVDAMLLERLGLKVGDRMKIGQAEILIAATLVKEPDGIFDRLTYGPRVLLGIPHLMQTGLVQPGALIRWRYAIALSGLDGSDHAAELDGVRTSLSSSLPENGFVVSDRRNPSPQVTRTLDRLRQFLTLLGLTALIVGGVGVANAVATFLDRRRKTIATMKSVGATGRTVFWVFLAQVMTIAAIGVALGLLAGVALPSAVAPLLTGYLPIVPEMSVSFATVGIAITYGFLVALLFALWPLGRAERMGANVLFREEVSPASGRPRFAVLGSMAVLVAMLASVAVVASSEGWTALYFMAALAAILAVFLGIGWIIVWTARRIRRPRRPELALAVANLAAPDGLTRAVVLSLGSGLSLLVAVALADNAMIHELRGKLPGTSPSYFVLDIPKGDLQSFSDVVKAEVSKADIVSAPMLRGRLVSLKGIAAEKVSATPEASWILNGDRGLTYSDMLPDGSKLVEGEWWPPGYAGEPLVSFEAELAKGVGVKIGDSVTVNVLGRNITARIANLREVQWESLSLNFVMVFTPNALEGAPHNALATITIPGGATTAEEVRLARAIGKAFPAITAIRVKDAIEAATAVYDKVMIAVRVAGGVTLLAGALVLAGAMATAQRRRIGEAVILKALGATRARIVAAHTAEYVLLSVLTASAAVVLGTLAAWLALTQVMDLEFVWSWTAVAGALGVALTLILVFGGVGTWSVLTARPVPYLRSE